MACKKKLYKYSPDAVPAKIETQRTKAKRRYEPCDPTSIEREVRQLLANKVSGNMVGIWMLVPEHLRLGTWDLLCGWSQKSPQTVWPRVAMQLIHESALCVCNLRKSRTLSQKGFELANGLPFVASDPAVHQLLACHSIEESSRLQVALGRIRRASGHFQGKILAIDPHRIRSYTQRQTRCYRDHKQSQPVKVSQVFFALDADTHQPVCFTIGSAARTVAQVTPELAQICQQILQPQLHQCLMLADTEHFANDLVEDLHTHTPFEFLIPLPSNPAFRKIYRSIPPDHFQPRWAGFATTTIPYQLRRCPVGPLYIMVQRSGEKPERYSFKGFLSNSKRPELEALTIEFPKRWHVEEFFNAQQALGWDRAGTQNLNIRYGHMTMALLAQAATHQLRQRLGPPFANWEARHFAQTFFNAIDGDIRVHDETITVTFYNAPHADRLRQHFEHLPRILAQESVDPRIPWLYNFKLDFRFR